MKNVYDEASKHGLIYVERINKGDSQGISPVHIEVSGIFVIECHFAVGSGISITKLLMEFTDSVFIEPSCYSNMIYLNRALGTIDDCIFSGRNRDYSINSVILNETKVFGVRVDKGTALLNKISFIEAKISEGDYYDRSLLLIQCTDNSNVDIKEAIVNGKNENEGLHFNNNVDQKKKKKNDSSDECKFGIVQDEEFEIFISDLWEMREMPNTSLNTANIENECLRYRRTIEVCD
ncbi:MAG: hypothetical protein EZS28_023622 [Streblomastix strix]|uniref:Uncharacterized protein n=1 Tax=Streblomastix strix TaxID=222440 RepID=A0A5J4VEI9_9EUKA|nr:MAG: hypothetical protein EZS28_023622 [Streblomastix strix]